MGVEGVFSIDSGLGFVIIIAIILFSTKVLEIGRAHV